MFQIISGIPFNFKINILKNRNLFKHQNKKILIESFPVKHGNIDSLCYLINKKLAYASDISLFYKKDYRRLMKSRFFDNRLSMVQKTLGSF